MAQTIQLPLAGGGKMCRGAGDGAAAMASETIEAVIGRRKPVAEVHPAELSDLASALDSVAVEFGVGVIANARAAIPTVLSEAWLKSTRSREFGLNLGRRMHPELP